MEWITKLFSQRYHKILATT